MWPQPRSRSAGAPGERSCTTQGVACVWEAARVVLAAARAETFLKRMGPISSFSSVDTAAPSCFSSAARRVQLAAMKNAPVPILSAKRVERDSGRRDGLGVTGDSRWAFFIRDWEGEGKSVPMLWGPVGIGCKNGMGGPGSGTPTRVLSLTVPPLSTLTSCHRDLSGRTGCKQKSPHSEAPNLLNFLGFLRDLGLRPKGNIFTTARSSVERIKRGANPVNQSKYPTVVGVICMRKLLKSARKLVNQQRHRADAVPPLRRAKKGRNSIHRAPGFRGAANHCRSFAARQIESCSTADPPPAAGLPRRTPAELGRGP
ncbi:hypothetical protein B0H14DRAFT_3785038 [Mycena olivaceomarginata]|nr:hypothetical protein B0H14DRAFT_3785038 [Mycena olivaceomarginata]